MSSVGFLSGESSLDNSSLNANVAWEVTHEGTGTTSQ